MDAALITEKDRQQISDWLSSPFDLPQEFKDYLVDYAARNIPLIPTSHFLGYVRTRAKAALVQNNESTTSATYTNLTTAGPGLTDVPDGTYLLIFGCVVGGGPGGGDVGCAMALSINGGAASDNDCAFGDPGTATTISVCYATLTDISGANNKNTVDAKYRRTHDTAGAAAAFASRFLVALRVSA